MCIATLDLFPAEIETALPEEIVCRNDGDLAEARRLLRRHGATDVDLAALDAAAGRSRQRRQMRVATVLGVVLVVHL